MEAVKLSAPPSSPPAQQMPCSPPLFTVLCGTHSKLGNHSPLQILEGQGDVLRIIFEMVCSEWWSSHIIPFPGDRIPILLPLSRSDIQKLPPNEHTGRMYPPERQQVSGCPVAIVAQGLQFPPPATVPMGTFHNQTSEDLYVNMMPICINSKSSVLDTLPPSCAPYLSMICKCVKRLAGRGRKARGSEDSGDILAYLTIDERPVLCGESQRRGGMHVESPGILPLKPHESVNGMYSPAAEHHWGNGMMMRQEIIDGGIFMASNVDDSCAVWNCHVIDPEGDVVGRMGDVRRLRDILGPPTSTLAAGDLVWMTDKSPHESLPLQRSAHRQYFRLVTGKITTWFASHSTPNPMWESEKMASVFALNGVNIVEGSKFELYKHYTCCKWKMGTNEELEAAQKVKALKMLLNEEGLGHVSDAFIASGIVSIDDFVQHWHGQWDGMSFNIDKFSLHYYERIQVNHLLEKLREKS
mmetsp:Transcript_24845/g.42056  ORF Transcript_24845/g.42056 Transcript_24845/m.42056 type:complete len:468 (+) Transcript_24845:53-1456(+)